MSNLTQKLLFENASIHQSHLCIKNLFGGRGDVEFTFQYFCLEKNLQWKSCLKVSHHNFFLVLLTSFIKKIPHEESFLSQGRVFFGEISSPRKFFVSGTRFFFKEFPYKEIFFLQGIGFFLISLKRFVAWERFFY